MQILYILTIILLVIVILPLVFLVLYLTRYLQIKDGNASRFRLIMFKVLIAVLMYLSGQTAAAIILASGRMLNTDVLLIVLIPMGVLAVAHWYAFFKTRKIIKEEIDGLVP